MRVAPHHHRQRKETSSFYFRSCSKIILSMLLLLLLYRWLMIGVIFDASSTASLTTNKQLEHAASLPKNNNNKVIAVATTTAPASSRIAVGVVEASSFATNHSKQEKEDETNTIMMMTPPPPPSSSSLLSFGDSFGYVDETSGRLIVHANETHLFWNKKAQLRLCRILRQMTHTKVLGEEEKELTLLLQNKKKKTTKKKKTLWLSVNCDELANSEAYGQGNWITALYMVRMATALAKVDFQFTCREEENYNDNTNQSRQNQLLPWFQGYYDHHYRSNNVNVNEGSFFTGIPPTAQEACTSKYERIRIDKLAHQIQTDMRQMAGRVINENNNMTTLFDDVAIHFRCGDVLGGQFRNDFGMIPFREYTKWIWENTTTSIGIITQPFQRDRNRKIDGNRAEACQVVVHTLVDYLQKHYPRAIVRIHNDPDTETLPIAYTRMVLAKQTFTSLSSFGIFPVIGTYGHGYFQKGNAGVNPWATHVPNYLSNVHEMNAPVLGTHDIYKMIMKSKGGLDSVLEWFVAEEEE